MAKKKSSELVMARVATVVAMVLCGAFLGWQFSGKKEQGVEDTATILATMPRFSHQADSRNADNTVVHVSAQVQGQRPGMYNLLLEVINFQDMAIYGEYKKEEILAFPHTFTMDIFFEKLQRVLKDRYNFGDKKFCEPMHIKLSLTALDTDIAYEETLRWRANVDMCNWGETFIPPQDIE